ncbi:MULTISPECIES: DNA mismatch repair endonuclease MutL [Bacillus amyloliquefaciens group]|uniref:DNA mismatch repair endonuclease MutL n=1 Tax=Bacillus amyloliquefaciens group TaxID=1938374 RepID=UPI0013645A5E|nr:MULTISPECIES: DNA mismatch repair endonuclease MutL [Bacillus amyloliquefaciens group]MBO3650405.1 DNA mismatch repair endonuclease MutL [Bacillus amyloliquefaciens]MCJ2174274.1 DNA mismatch repair endonuclease MutL [Bacillus amyloliquefaciens]MCR4348697.1 DNA mismatch repair endonuclease MutL [Bacillus amyloliquefaciens]MCR4357338.1 DNA mismatch repair endonuclease MutL [Bacillus amyloliquefaciens]MEC1481579.1 DNA mismatch repair endonuclease MutL [Bacillus velezensis]
MAKVIQLSDELSNKIAAGEVVERPASVVKELVENAIDANSTVIEIDIEEAGLSSIRVLDNGEGMETDDCKRAFRRHATSKIKDENDLFRVRTLGFRGEALPSIASVSHLEIKTSNGEGAGTHLILQGGNIISEQKSSSRKGTEIIVTNLFFNTPARLKYMKTVHTELGNITDVVNRIALAHPEVSIRLRHQGKNLLQTNGNGDVRHVLAAIYGTAVAKKMIPLHVSSLDFEVKGYIALPEITRASRNYMSSVINGRYIKNFPLVKAVHEGYHTLLPIGRHPITFIEITMDPILVDVNVHPSKLEVRLSKETELHELIRDGIKEVFQKQRLIPSAQLPKKSAPAPAKNEQQFMTFEERAPERKLPEKTPEPSYSPMKLSSVVKEPEPVIIEEEILPNEADHDVPPKIGMPETAAPVSDTPEPEAVSEEIREERVPVMYPIGQMHGTYILAQNENGLYIIDQHAAQERIKYEYFREKVGQVEPEVQDMIVPLTFHYAANEALIIDQHQHELESVGVFLEAFGTNSYIVRCHPAWFPKGEEAELIEEIIQQVLDAKQIDIKKLREEAAIMMSCKGSIKANRHLRNDEIKALLDDLRRTTDPFTCPHGRPIIIHHSTYEMEKMFKRVM